MVKVKKCKYFEFQHFSIAETRCEYEVSREPGEITSVKVAGVKKPDRAR